MRARTHWCHERLSEVFLRILQIWFLGWVAWPLARAKPLVLDPFFYANAGLFTLAFFYHWSLMIQVAIEDYIRPPARTILLWLLWIGVIGACGLVLCSIALTWRGVISF